MAAMETSTFARRFEQAYRDLYLRAVRRVRDKRERLTAETTAFLLHLAEAGPMGLTELARHMGRAQSTTSEMVEHLVAKALLAREPDPADARRSLIWLTAEGRDDLAEALQVLDEPRLARAAEGLTPAERADLTRLMDRLNTLLKEQTP